MSYRAVDVDGNTIVEAPVAETAAMRIRVAAALPQELPADSADFAVAALATDAMHVTAASAC